MGKTFKIIEPTQFFGNTDEYFRFAFRVLLKNLSGKNKILFRIVKWNRTLYNIFIRKVLRGNLKSRFKKLNIAGLTLTYLEYVELYGKRYYYDSANEIVHFKRHAKAQARSTGRKSNIILPNNANNTQGNSKIIIP